MHVFLFRIDSCIWSQACPTSGANKKTIPTEESRSLVAVWPSCQPTSSKWTVFTDSFRFYHTVGRNINEIWFSTSFLYEYLYVESISSLLIIPSWEVTGWMLFVKHSLPRQEGTKPGLSPNWEFNQPTELSLANSVCSWWLCWGLLA